MQKDKYVAKALSIHGNEYSYEKVPNEFLATNKIDIFCKTCGRYFSSIARNHTNNQTGCPICGRKRASQKLTKDFDYFASKAKLIHNDKYCYFKDKFIQMNKNTEIKCNTCGNIFTQKPSMHIIGNGCPNCNSFPKRLTTELFVEQLKKEHPNLQLISDYNGNKKYLSVKCLIHNHTFQTKPNWLHNGHDCPVCNSSHLEMKTYSILKEKSLLFITEKTFEWLKPLKLDFYIPSLKLAIECQGLQHFKPINFFGGKSTFILQQDRDIRKYNVCEKNGIKMLYIIDKENKQYITEHYESKEIIPIDEFTQWLNNFISCQN